MTTWTWVRPLSELGPADAARYGRKAATLGELAAAGFAVPAGFALAADAPDEVDELPRVLAALGGGPVAVRSSGVAEDLAGRSYAGQYETVLDVRGLPATVDAIRTCRASAQADRVAVYRSGSLAAGTGEEDDDPPGLGVLIQTMVDATAAGVAFSCDPRTGDSGQTLISAVTGLGDRLVSGEVDAEEWTVRADEAECTRPAPVPALDAGQARAVADLARRVADHLGGPQDIEWAYAGGTLWLLQSRPITTLPGGAIEPVPIELRVPAGVSTRSGAMDRVWTPFERSVFLPIFSGAIRYMFSYTTAVKPVASSIGGWIYITVPPEPPGPEALAAARAAVDSGQPDALISQWHETGRRAFAHEITGLRAVDLAGLTDAGLELHLRTLIELFGRLHDRYFRLTGAAIAVSARLGALCARLLGWTPPQVARLRGGLAGDHMGAAIGLGDLARLAAARPPVREFLGGPDPDPARLADVDAEFARAFADYVARYAHRTVGFDLTEPTLAEQPGVLLALIRAQLDTPYDFATERAGIEARIAGALAEARTALAGADPADRDRFEAAVAAGVRSSPIRDEKVYWAVSAWALLRYATLELGRRLADRNQVDAADDVFYLAAADALIALADGTDRRGVVRHHRGQFAWALANPGPPAYPPDALPPTPPPTASDVDSGTLRGLAASTGRYLGSVRVIRGAAEFGKLRHGDVLVCPETTAQWSLLFPSVGALVTDRGSLLSHPAIIAREYGVPAVVATGTATDDLRDDDVVLVDGTAGVVRLVTRAPVQTAPVEVAA